MKLTRVLAIKRAFWLIMYILGCWCVLVYAHELGHAAINDVYKCNSTIELDYGGLAGARTYSACNLNQEEELDWRKLQAKHESLTYIFYSMFMVGLVTYLISKW